MRKFDSGHISAFDIPPFEAQGRKQGACPAIEFYSQCTLQSDCWRYFKANFTEGGDYVAEKIIPRGSSIGLARLLGITDRRVRQLTEQGVLSRQAEGDFIYPEAIEEYYAYKYKSNEEVDYMAEKALHEKTKRELAELELAKRRNEVHDAEDVQIVMVDMLTKLRSQLLGLPTKMAKLLAERDASYIDAALTQEIEERLQELSDYSPTMFSEETFGNEEENG